MKNLKWLGLGIMTAGFLCFAPIVAHAQPTPPDGGTDWPTNLNSWSFYDTNTWMSDLDYPPISFTNISAAELGDQYSMLLDSTNPAWLQYNVFENDGKGDVNTNLTVDQGSITLWFAPHSWASTNGGTGPGDWGRLIEVGAYTTNASYGWWSLFLDPGASNVYFSAQTNSGDGATTTYLSAPIGWNTNEWHFLGLTYSATNSALYLDGLLVTNGLPVTVYPGLNVLTNGFYIGSDSNGLSQAHGMFDNIQAFNYPLDAGTISNLFAWEVGIIRIDPWNVVPNNNIESSPSSPSTVPTFNAVTGSGSLTAIGTNTSDCVTSSNVWITNVTAAVVGTNMSLTFTIAGGSNGVPYDVFANSVLDFSSTTNAPWAWMGQGYQCVTYTITNLPVGTCFLILGTPQDSDADGLTDAYEKLVSKTDPNNSNSSGDGMLDGWKVLWGMNPLINNAAQPSERANYIYDGTGRLEIDSGIESEIFNFDPEGNIQLDQQ
jgi:hypothetical protein